MNAGDLGQKIVKILRLATDDQIELFIDRLDENRILVRRVPVQERHIEPKSDSSSRKTPPMCGSDVER
jgi:hypothetical protein